MFWKRHALLQSEFQQGLARDLHLVSLGDDLRPRSHGGAGSRSDGRPFAVACNGTNDASNGASANGPFRRALAFGLA